MPDLQSKRVVALLNASDDTADMFQRMLVVSGVHRLIGGVRKMWHRGGALVNWQFLFTAAVYNYC